MASPVLCASTVSRFIREDLSKYNLSTSCAYCTIAGEALNPSVYEEWSEAYRHQADGRVRPDRDHFTVATYSTALEPKPGLDGQERSEYDNDLADA